MQENSAPNPPPLGENIGLLNDTAVKAKLSIWRCKRHLQFLMAFLGISLGYAVRVTLSVAIVAMTDKASANKNFQEFDWGEDVKSAILSSFFWGYLALQIPAGHFSQVFGAKHILLTGMGVNAALVMLTPLAATYGGSVAVCCLRIGQGLGQGCFFPCATSLVSKWSPKEERARAFTFVYTGSNFGTLAGLPIAGMLASSSGGWPSVFYVTGGACIVWCLAWWFFGASTPSEHPTIRPEELKYIQGTLNADDPSLGEKTLKTPWKSIVTSIPMWAILIAHLGQNWGWWTLLTEMPSYINSVLGFDIKKNGFLSALPYLCGWISAIVMSWIADYAQRHSIFSNTVRQKFWTSIALWGCGLSLFALSVTSVESPIVPLFLLTLAVTLDSGINCGFMSNHMELSPNYCGTLMGITNSIANISSILGPICVGFIVTDSKSEAQWKIVFLVSACVMFTSNLIYIIFGSSKMQSWNEQRNQIENRVNP